MGNRVYVGIVTFNPCMERLKENIDAIKKQVEDVLVFDNGSSNYDEIIKNLDPDVIILKSEKNIGIAAALNRLIEWGENNGFQWMISLDHDSVCGYDFVENMMPYLNITEQVGIVAPIIIDRNIGVVGHNPESEWAEVRTCITSGSFNSIVAWRKVGGYDESMFIDSVDFEYCYRLRKNGYKVIQVSKVQLLHELGKSQKRRFLFWRVDVNGHSAFRKYYIARNNVYYPLKHHLWLHFVRGNLRNLWLLVVVSLYEENKTEKKKSILRGWKDGLKGNMS